MQKKEVRGMSEQPQTWTTEPSPSQVWAVPKSKISFGETVKEIEGEVKPEDVISFARSLGLKKFVVKDEQGNLLSAGDFPKAGTFTLEEYNEAK